MIPFPEAVTPGQFTYYISDSSGRARGVLITDTPATVANGTIGGYTKPIPVYASAALDEIVRDALEGETSE